MHRGRTALKICLHEPGVSLLPLRNEYMVALTVAIPCRGGGGVVVIVGSIRPFLWETNGARRKARRYHEGSGAGDIILRKGEDVYIYLGMRDKKVWEGTETGEKKYERERGKEGMNKQVSAWGR